MGQHWGKHKKKKPPIILPDPHMDSKQDAEDENPPHRDKSLRPLPQVPVPPKNRVKGMYDFQAINNDDLSFKKGDIMELDDSTSETDDWWLAIHLVTRKKGYVPSNYVTAYDENAESSPKSQEWWFEIDRRESDKLLLHPGNPKGTFVVREAADKQSYVLSIRDNDQGSGDPCVKHYRIRKMDGENGFYISAKKTFKDLLDVIQFYKENSNGLCCKLTKACPTVRPVVAFRELEIGRNLIKLSKKLGAGCFGEVWKGTLRKVVEVAVKTLKPGTMSPEAFLDEAKIMHKLTHPKLVQLMAVVSIEEPFWIVTELMSKGALLDFLRSDEGHEKMKFETVTDFNAQIADAMSYLDSQNYVHRDLRAANILVGENMVVKVADFGLARILHKSVGAEEGVYEAGENTKFPIKWTAPEAIANKKFSSKSDVWSFGIVMYEIITLGKAPYPGHTSLELIAWIAQGNRMAKPKNGPIDVPDAYYDTMLTCWNVVPEDRPTFDYLFDFFENYQASVETKYNPIGNT